MSPKTITSPKYKIGETETTYRKRTRSQHKDTLESTDKCPEVDLRKQALLILDCKESKYPICDELTEPIVPFDSVYAANIHRSYETFYKKITDPINLRRYTGPRFAYVKQYNPREQRACANYEICLGRRWYSFSRGGSNGYFYFYLDRKYRYKYTDCLMKGDHITIGNYTDQQKRPTDKLDLHISHYEIIKKDRNVQYTNEEDASYLLKSEKGCKIYIDDIREIIRTTRTSKTEKIRRLKEIQVYRSSNTLGNIIDQYSRYALNDNNISVAEISAKREQLTEDLITFLYYLFRKGFS